MLCMQNVSKSFSKTEAVKPTDLTLPDGAILGLVGSNGAGKSTMMRLLCGVYKPDTGEVRSDVGAVYDNPAAKAQIFFVPDELYFLPQANIRRMAKFYADAYVHTFRMERFDELCATLAIDQKKPLGQMSKGMKRQAAIVLALSCRPRYLLLDEAFDGLDPVRRRVIRKLLNELAAEEKGAVVLTSHSLRELEGVCDRLALLHEGSLVLDGDTAHLKDSRFRVRAAFAYPCDADEFADLNVRSFEQDGSLIQMIVEGDAEEITYSMQEREPLLLDVLPLNLEEIFLQQMRTLGYDDRLLAEEETEGRV